MNVFLYSTEYLVQLLPEDIAFLISKLPPFLQREATRFRRWQDTYGCIFGKYLLEHGLRKMGLTSSLFDLRYSKEQKPYLPDGPHFNISHSANRVVCLICEDRRVGIDIEIISHEICLDNFRSPFTHNEWQAICDSQNPKEQFYQYWTAKESIVKADGRGLSLPLEEIDVSSVKMARTGDIIWRLVPIPIFKGYACHIAFEDGPTRIDFKLYEIKLNDFLITCK